jgi:hypothetical protein
MAGHPSGALLSRFNWVWAAPEVIVFKNMETSDLFRPAI